VVFEEIGIAVHGQGFAAREVPEDLTARYPAPLASLFNIGLLHTSLNGRPGHEPYAPSSVDALRSKGYDYWALGHVHAREVVCEDPLVVFPGNLQGRHAREVGPKGATLIAIDGGRIVEARHEPLDVVRWAAIAVDAAAAADADEAVELVRERLAQQAAQAGGRLLAARVLLTGQSRAHAQLARDPERWLAEIRSCALDVGGGNVWIEKVELQTRSLLDLAQLADSDDAIGQLARSLQALAIDPAGLGELGAVLAELKRKLPREALQGDDGLRLDDPAFLSGVLGDVRELILGRLLEGEGA
jgi:DNA repair exonuclease SbcCD nuclease subunit